MNSGGQNMRVLENVQPQKVFYYFEELAGIPHGSYHTKAISDYCMNFAKERELEAYQDAYNNVVIIKEATDGYENAEPIILQGHLDMVCEKENDTEIDFENEGLRLFIDGDFVKAKGTTLGGDDGIAIAYSLAILDSDDIAHPRLECVFTVDEEVGMLGAEKIDLSMSITGIPIAHKPIHRHFKIILYDRAMISVSNTFPDRAIFLIFRLQ